MSDERITLFTSWCFSGERAEKHTVRAGYLFGPDMLIKNWIGVI